MVDNLVNQRKFRSLYIRLTELWKSQQSRKLRFRIFNFQFLRQVWHESVVSTSSTFSFCGLWREVWHESVVFTASTFTLRKVPRENFVFTSSTFNFFEGGLARKLCFTVSTFHFLRTVSREMQIWEIVDTRNSLFRSTVPRKMEGAGLPRRTVSAVDHSRIVPALELTVQVSFWQLQPSVLKGRLARKLPFHSFKCLFFEGGLARNGGFHCVNFHFLRKVSCEMRFER